MKKLVAICIVAGAGAMIWLIAVKRSTPPQVPFTRVARETIVSTLSTNGKVEPVEWTIARAERAGQVEEVRIQKGQRVSAGQTLVELNARVAQTDLVNAQARIAEANAELQVLSSGGRASELALIDNGLAQARLERAAAEKDYASLGRLAARQAATPVEVRAAKQRLDRAEEQIRGFEARRAALTVPTDKTIAQAKLKAAQADAALAQRNISLSAVRSPMDGTIYQFDLKKGAYLNPGDVVAYVGRLDQVRIAIYVDEPELGRVAKRDPVVIGWSALPGRQWKGEVEKVPTEIVALGTRQVGEATSTVRNPGNELLPGTNVDVEVRSKVEDKALTVPKEALRREAMQNGVYRLAGDRIRWQRVTLGISSTTRTAVEGLREGDSVALPTERALSNGMRVTPVYP